MKPSLWAVLAGVLAVPLPGSAQECRDADPAAMEAVGEWTKACVSDVGDMDEKAVRAAGTSARELLSDCIELSEPCLRFADAHDELVKACGESNCLPRCRRVCRYRKDGSINCPPPPAAVDCGGAPPEEPQDDSGQAAAWGEEVSADAEAEETTRHCEVVKGKEPATTMGWIRACIKAARGRPVQGYTDIICLAQGSAALERGAYGDETLRNADHYFTGACMAGSLKSNWVFNWSPALCTITGGYSALKIHPLMRWILKTGDKPCSPPSVGEVFWGCFGALDGTSKRFP